MLQRLSILTVPANPAGSSPPCIHMGNLFALNKIPYQRKNTLLYYGRMSLCQSSSALYTWKVYIYLPNAIYPAHFTTSCPTACLQKERNKNNNSMQLEIKYSVFFSYNSYTWACPEFRPALGTKTHRSGKSAPSQYSHMAAPIDSTLTYIKLCY